MKQEKGKIMQLKMFLLAGLLVLGVSLSAENLLVNGDFKQQKNSLPAAWSVVGKIDVTSKISGGVTPESGVVCFSVSPGKNNGSLRQNVRQKVQVGKKYRLSVAMKVHAHGLISLENWEKFYNTCKDWERDGNAIRDEDGIIIYRTDEDGYWHKVR